MTTQFKNRGVVGSPFTIELDVESYSHSTGTTANVDLSTATPTEIRLISPTGVATDHTATLPGSPTGRLQYASSDGSELTAAGTWHALAVYTLGGNEYESFPVPFQVLAASATP